MASDTSTPSPYVFPSSQEFHGNDGPWSTFILRVGAPAQNFHVLPSTNGVNTVVPLAEGCAVDSPDNITAPSNCGSLRGAFPFNNHKSSGFTVNDSTTWQSIGLFELRLGSQYDINVGARYGYDTVGLALQNSGGPTLDGQVLAGIARKQFFLGVIPLGTKPTNFSTFDNPQPSYLTSLRETGVVPGLGFGYTAGARYRYTGVTASLVLGGYDMSRFDSSKSKTFVFGHDDDFDFTVGLQAIVSKHTLQGTVSLLTNGIIASIDSTLPYLWLPEELYLVNDTIHEQLKQLNPTVSFTLGDGTTTGTGEDHAVVIDLPYGAFDLQASWPLTENTTNYFPLKRATNSTQYTLGRAFLQEAYLSVDYERRIFNVSQAKFDSPMSPQQVVSILPQGATEPSTPRRSALSSAAKAGVGAGVSVAVLLLLMLVFLCYKRRQDRSAVQKDIEAHPRENPSDAKEIASKQIFEVHENSRPNEADAGGSQLYELPSSHGAFEMLQESRQRKSTESRLGEIPTGNSRYHENA